MSLNARIKERREQLGMSRPELAAKLGVTPSAIANYENSVSSPKIELLFKLFDALQCDANYLFQDEMTSPSAAAMPTPAELEHIKKYRDLDDHGTRMVNMVLDEEYTRISVPEASAPITPLSDPYAVNAAHELDPTPEERKHADEIMMNDEEWK